MLEVTKMLDYLPALRFLWPMDFEEIPKIVNK